MLRFEYEKYWFSPIDQWDPKDTIQTQILIDQLLKDAVRLPVGFNAMGSMSTIQQEVGLSVLKGGLPKFEREAEFDLDLYRRTPTKLKRINKSTDALRYVPTLKYLNEAETRKIEKSVSIFERDNELLERANTTHQMIINRAIPILRAQGYDTLANSNADLVAEDEKSILLFEAKSIPEGKFRSQARSAIGQLYQYEHFDIRDHQAATGTCKSVSKLLLIPHDPGDAEYVAFMNWMKISTCVPRDGKFITIR